MKKKIIKVAMITTAVVTASAAIFLVIAIEELKRGW